MAIISGLALTLLNCQPVQAQRRGSFNQGERRGSALSQQPSRTISRPQSTPRLEEGSRPQQVPQGRPYHRRETELNTSGNSMLSGHVNQEGNQTYTSPRPKGISGKRNYTIDKNESADLNNPSTDNNRPLTISPAPRPRRNTHESGGGWQSNSGDHSTENGAPRPNPRAYGAASWTHQPRQLTHADYRRAPLAYRYYYPGNRGYYNAYNPCWRYSYLPRYHSVIYNFYYPFSTIYWGGIGYRYCSGVYYSPFGAGFRVVPPPFGIYIDILPMGYETVYGFNSPYYYYNGTYYEDYDNSYRVIAPPVGAVVESIPDGYETITIDGETYYKVENVQYKPVVQDNGEIWYQVIKVG